MRHEVIATDAGNASRMPAAGRPPLRILHVMRAPVGGLFRHVRDLARAQAERGHLVGVVCDSTACDQLTESRLSDLADVLQLGLVRMPIAREPGLTDRTVWHTISDLCAALRIDVVHGHGAKGGAYARLARRRLVRRGQTIASFYTPHGGTLNYKPTHPIGWVYMRVEKLLASATDGIVFESAHAKRQYDKRVGAPDVASRVIFNGLQPAEFEPIARLPDAAEFLYLGELRAIKGVDVLLAAFAKVNAATPCRLALFGDGPEREALGALADHLGISARIVFHRATPIRNALAMGCCMVVPSRAESLPYVVLETAAAGVPIISTDVGGIPEIMAGSDTDLIPADDVEALATAMRKVLAEPSAATARAERLKACVAGRFTVATMTDDILAFYADALAHRSTAGAPDRPKASLPLT